jgi:D-apionolactonase
MYADARGPRDDRFLHGSATPPVVPRQLRAGPIAGLFDGSDFRRAKLDGIEVVRRIYAAVRDVNWDTVPLERSREIVEAVEQAFKISYQARYLREELDLTAEVTIEGLVDGTLRFSFQGTANADFPYCRIGICVLHPPEAAGRAYRAETPAGAIQGKLPVLVGPQWIRDGKLQALIPSYRQLAIEAAEELEVDFRFAGDLFEMEDQRNWTDASFKTYSTPIALGFPHQARRGQVFSQSVEVRCLGRAPAPATAAPVAEASPASGRQSISRPAGVAPARLRLTVGRQLRAGLPPIGLGHSSVIAALSGREIDLLKAVGPDHLRVEARPGGEDAGLRAAISACKELGTGLEVGAFLSPNPAGELERLAVALRDAPIRRFLIFKEGSPCSDAALVGEARARLASEHPGARFFAGTNIYFADLNRTRPDPEGTDGLTFTITPQVHDSDEMSLMENVQVQGDAVRSARALAGERREVAVSPVTLKPRFNPFANRSIAVDPNKLPFAVDPRQASLFGAAWTVGSLKYIIEAGAGAMTYFETVGWRGLIESAAGAPGEGLFPSRPGMIFPVYWVFRDLGGWRSAAVLACDSSDPRRVAGLALRLNGRTRLLVANLTPEPQETSLVPGTQAAEAMVTLVDQGSYDPVPAATAPVERSRSKAALEGGRLALRLNPYAVACVDAG